MSLKIDSVAKAFGLFPALSGVSLDVAEGEFLALLGPSGSGKTTLLRILAGLEFADEGRVLFDGKEAQALPIADRQVGMVFQHYALFGHMSVFNNVAFGLKVRSRKSRPQGTEIAERVARLLHLVQLDGLGDRFPGSSRAGSDSGSRSPARLRPSQRCCCSTSPSARLTPRSGWSCVVGCATFTIRPASPPSS